MAVETKKLISTSFSSLLLVSCLAFVAWESKICIEKFLDNPKSIDISYEKTQDMIFPTISFCSLNGNENNDLKPVAHKKEAFNECSLDHGDYFNRGPWSSEACSDPKEFLLKAFPTWKDLPIADPIKIKFQDHTERNLSKGDPSITWSQVPYERNSFCNSLTFSKELTLKGKSLNNYSH